MITALKTNLVECENPVGVKKTSNWKLPPKDFAYGKPGPQDEEGVSVITRSWKVHKPSREARAPQDFIRINKLAVKMNATTYGTHKDFRKSVDIKKKIPHGTKERRIVLPPEDFAYGMRNRTPTPIKDVINGSYGNRAAQAIGKEYKAYIKEKQTVNQLRPKTTTHWNRLYNSVRAVEEPEKPPYKMKMFKNVGSKVKEEVKKFKTYRGKEKKNDGLDEMINKVQNEIDNEKY